MARELPPGKHVAHGRNKYQSRESRARIREILLHQWDPIGVSDVPEAADEYDAYVGKVYTMLMDDRAEAAEIANYLFNLATKHMLISPSESLVQGSDEVAKLLVGLRPEFETH